MAAGRMEGEVRPMKYSLRNLMIVMLVLPPLLAGGYWLWLNGGRWVVGAFIVWLVALYIAWRLDSRRAKYRSQRDMSQFRNLWDGIKFFASMLGGSLATVLFQPPQTSHGPEESANRFVWQVVIGAVAGGIAWQCYKGWRDRQRPPA